MARGPEERRTIAERSLQAPKEIETLLRLLVCILVYNLCVCHVSEGGEIAGWRREQVCEVCRFVDCAEYPREVLGT
jgi:hypothetical protein